MPVSGDFRKLRSMISNLQQLARPATRSELTVRLGKHALELVDRCFTGGHDPDGNRWLPVLRGGAPLRLTERLRHSIHLFSDARGFRLASELIYARVQNAGAVIRAKSAEYLVFQINGRWSKKRTVRIPARQFIPSPGKLPASWAADFRALAIELGREVMER